MSIALDRSLRSYDLDGHLSVEECNLSKAMVCPYFGREIPKYQELGLDPEKVYQLYRDPAELEAAAPTFHLKPLLIVHKAVSADQPAQELNAGAIGAAAWKPPYLTAPIAIWTAEAARLVESGKKEQLSAGYRYRADMTPGMADGVPFDGIMRDIKANHVALVVEGRCGPDVVVPDELPPELKMRRPKLVEALKPFLAKDADLAALDAALVTAVDEKEEETEEEAAARKKKEAADKKAKDGKSAKDAKSAKDGDDDEDEDDKKKAKDKKGAKDGNTDFESDKDKGAKDGITQDQLDAAVAAGVKLAREQANDLHAAREEAAPICGVVALDSGEAVRAFALKHLKVDIEGVPPSAYKALLSLARQKSTPAPRIAMDAAAANASTIWPVLARIRA
jgi:hypothetical protein